MVRVAERGWDQRISGSCTHRLIEETDTSVAVVIAQSFASPSPSLHQVSRWASSGSAFMSRVSLRTWGSQSGWLALNTDLTVKPA